MTGRSRCSRCEASGWRASGSVVTTSCYLTGHCLPTGKGKQVNWSVTQSLMLVHVSKLSSFNIYLLLPNNTCVQTCTGTHMHTHTHTYVCKPGHTHIHESTPYINCSPSMIFAFLGKMTETATAHLHCQAYKDCPLLYATKNLRFKQENRQATSQLVT